MKKIILPILFLLCFLAPALHAQEFNFSVTINTKQVAGTDQRVYDALQEAVTNFMNNQVWTNIRFEEQLHHADCIAEIMEFAVDPSHRDQGIGKGMLEKACEIAREQGCSQIEVACNQLRHDTHRFYIREGMHNFHYKFSKTLSGDQSSENVIGR